jgi:hypothetical protein
MNALTPSPAIERMHSSHRTGADLHDDPLQPVAARGHGGPVGVGEQHDRRVTHRDARGRLPQRGDGGRHVRGVERARHRERAQPRPGGRVRGQRGQLRRGPGGDDLARAVDVRGGEAVRLEHGEHLVLLAAEDRGHAGGLGGRGLGHGPAAHADQAHRVVGGNHPGDRPGGQFADAVPGRGTRLPPELGEVTTRCTWAGSAAKRLGGGERGGDEQRLGDRGVGDLVLARGRPVADQVAAGQVRPGGKTAGEAGQVQPGGQEARGLRPLARGRDNEHSSTLHCRSPLDG